ncbi:MAG TPA: ornithine cyclodeaminase family protein [Steroidobacteraceae bacterium]|nr:ornithine cyclodeaminase family protein [Steroidobacteraceae bacterium]
MEIIADPLQIRKLAPMPALIEALAVAFSSVCTVLPRTIVAVPGGDGLLASMPAFDEAGASAVKLATLYPGNAAIGLPTTQAVIVLFSATGTPEAVLDATIVTRLRTGAASALASRYLSRPDSAHLMIMGTGALAPYMALGHCAVRPIERISVWGRRRDRAAATQAEMQRLLAHVQVSLVENVEHAVATADIVTCATSSPTPLLAGRWLRPGTFVDLVGSFAPTTREADDDVVRQARIFVDTFAGALSEAGDLLQPLERGTLRREQIVGELSDLVRGRVAGRTAAHEITLFKSVGCAIADLAAARMILGATNAGC